MMTRKNNYIAALISLLAIPISVGSTWAQTGNDSVMGSHTFEPEQIRSEIRFVGSTQPNIQPLAFRSTGRLLTLLADAGDVVTKGQVLAKLDTAELDDEVAIAREAHDQAKREFKRGEVLYSQKVIGLQALEELQFRASQARLRLDALFTRLELATITAPEDGLVTARFFDYPIFVKRETTVFHFTEAAEPTRVVGTVFQADAVKLKVGQEATIQSLGPPSEKWTGKVIHIQSTKQSGFFNVEVTLQDPVTPDIARPGQLYDVIITLDEERRAYRIPPELLKFDKQRENNSYVIVTPELGRRLDVNVVYINELGAYITTAETEGPIEILLRDY